MIQDPFRFIPVRLRRVLFALALAAIAFVSLWSHNNLEAHVSHDIQSRDYMIHFFCYLVLSAMALWSFGRRSRPRCSRLFAALLCFSYGALMEVLQTLPAVGRSCSLTDIRNNLLGALVGALLPRFLWPGIPSSLKRS